MRIHIPTLIRWSDLDAYGHVNNATMLSLLEEARVQAFWAGPGPEHDGPQPTRILAGGARADTLTLIARQEIEYLAPIEYLREPLDLQVWISHLGGASMDVCYEIYSPVGSAEQTLFAKALTTIVLVDAATSQPRRMTDAEREVLTPYVGDPIIFKRRN